MRGIVVFRMRLPSWCPPAAARARPCVLDACAAPGGKSCHILESERSLTGLTCIDKTQSKLDRIQENLTRLDLEAKLGGWRCQRYRHLVGWRSVRSHSAGCSLFGNWRHTQAPRHQVAEDATAGGEPDLGSGRATESIYGLVSNPVASCSIPPALYLGRRTKKLIRRFLDSTDSAKYEAITADWGVECAFGRQLLPGTGLGPDGFFYSVLRKEYCLEFLESLIRSIV